MVSRVPVNQKPPSDAMSSCCSQPDKFQRWFSRLYPTAALKRWSLRHHRTIDMFDDNSDLGWRDMVDINSDKSAFKLQLDPSKKTFREGDRAFTICTCCDGAALVVHEFVSMSRGGGDLAWLTYRVFEWSADSQPPSAEPSFGAHYPWKVKTHVPFVGSSSSSIGSAGNEQEFVPVLEISSNIAESIQSGTASLEVMESVMRALMAAHGLSNDDGSAITGLQFNIRQQT